MYLVDSEGYVELKFIEYKKETENKIGGVILKKVLQNGVKFKNPTITITFGDVAENHVGMQKIGTEAKKGFSLEDLENAKNYCTSQGLVCELVKLNNSELTTTPAYVLIVRKGLSLFITEETLINEMNNSEWDTKLKTYGTVKDKHARYNLCWGETDQEPDYENGKGRVYDINKSVLNTIRKGLPKVIGDIGEGLFAEGNLYYDTSICGIGYHGDGERKKVVAFRVGESMPIIFQAFQDGKLIGEPNEFLINSGDMYFMSEKATGNDWKKKKILTYRHAAGCKKYTVYKKKVKK